MPPPHHHKKHCDRYWSEMPESAKKAAYVLQYTPESWDADAKVAYDHKSFEECTTAEKHAAMYLGLSPIDKKLDPIYWENVTEPTKAHAMALGWDQHKWDHDWNIKDLPVEHLYWKELNEDQRSAAIYFGYSPILWDETGTEEEVFGRWSITDETPPKGSPPPQHFNAPPPPAGLEEKKEGEEQDITAEMEQMNVGSKKEETGMEESDEEEEEVEEEEETGDAAQGTKKKKVRRQRKKNPFKLSKPFGSPQGAMFDHSNHRHIDQIKVWADRHCINGMEVSYSGGVTRKAGNSTKGKEHVYKLAAGEYINGVKVRSNKTVQSLAFQTTKNRWIGPVGGKGWMIGADKAGEEVAVKPFNKVLAGFKGRATDDHLMQIVFSWGPVPGKN